MTSAPLAVHLQSLIWSPAAASGPCGEGLAGGHRQPRSGPRGSVVADTECSHTSGTCLGCRMVADEREREAGGSSMLKGGKVSGRLGAKPGNGRIPPDCVLCNGSCRSLERDRELGFGHRGEGWWKG